MYLLQSFIVVVFDDFGYQAAMTMTITMTKIMTTMMKMAVF